MTFRGFFTTILEESLEWTTSKKIVVFKWPLAHNALMVGSRLECVGKSACYQICDYGVKETQKHCLGDCYRAQQVCLRVMCIFLV